ncbi:MAG: biopolymer transporter ExbD [Candidatus Eremiobacteraeota bacterium]|nr:biopolymer transporter ExbD [Candidatus Eremiobacteraeota bacterium]MBV8281641.1 biopolymer transporter ExbD [Candidatus Eremiobacteraeota bacterium]
MGLTSTAQDTEVMAEINITPFTDVLLVLLIIFMILAALAAPPGFQKELPKKSDAPTKINQNQLHHQIDVEVSANNRVFIDGRQTTDERLYDDMAAAVKFHKENANRGYLTHISLVADSAASYNTIIKILDAARQANDDDVGFVTQ